MVRPLLGGRGPISHYEQYRLELHRLERTVQHHLMRIDPADEGAGLLYNLLRLFEVHHASPYIILRVELNQPTVPGAANAPPYHVFHYREVAADCECCRPTSYSLLRRVLLGGRRQSRPLASYNGAPTRIRPSGADQGAALVHRTCTADCSKPSYCRLGAVSSAPFLPQCSNGSTPAGSSGSSARGLASFSPTRVLIGGRLR